MAQKTEVETPANPPSGASEPPRNAFGVAAASPKRVISNERPARAIILIAALLVLIVGGFFAWRYFSRATKIPMTPSRRPLMPLSARISGYVTSVNVNDNQYVKAGPCSSKSIRTIIKSRSNRPRPISGGRPGHRALPEYQCAHRLRELRSARYLRPKQMSTTRKPESPSRQQQSDAAKAQLAQAEANDVKAQQDLVRYKQLVDKQEVSQQPYDQAVATAKATAAAVASARASRHRRRAASRPGARASSRRPRRNSATAQTGPSAGCFHPRARSLRRRQREAQASRRRAGGTES